MADVKLEEGDAEIERENLESKVSVTARLDNRDLGSTMKEIQQRVKKKINLPSGYHVEYGEIGRAHV